MFLYIKPVINDFVLNRINYIIDELKNAKPGRRVWLNSDKYPEGKDYNLTERSTYPFYIKFAYEKRPKSWYSLSEEEKLKERIYYQYNSKNIMSTFNKILNGKALTLLQQSFVEELMTNFYIFEKEFEMTHQDTFDNVINFYNNNSNNSIIDIDMTNCPF